jgi:hypothetical protein
VKSATTRKATARKAAPKSVATPKPLPTPPAPDAAVAPAKTYGLLGRLFRDSIDSIEGATLSVGGTALGSIPGLPKGATEKMQTTHAKVIHGTTDRIELVATESASVVGKAVAAVFSPFRKLFG